MVYKIDNRVKKHRGRYTVLGIVLGIALCCTGFYLYDNYKVPIVEGVGMLKNTAITQGIKYENQVTTNNIKTQLTQPTQNQPVTTNTVVNSQSDNQIQTNSQIPTTSYSLDQLDQIALNDINQYRQQNGLNILPLENAKASQVWADHLLALGCITHREGNVGPIQRYLDNGDTLQMVFENVSGGYGTETMNVDQSIKKADYDMMFNDVDQSNGHRDNILNPSHTSVSIGIAYNNNKLVLVEDFQQSIGIYNWRSFDLAYDDTLSCW